MNKRSKTIVSIIAVTACLSAISLPASSRSDDDDDDWHSLRNLIREVKSLASQVKRGFEIVPPGVHLNMEGKDRRLVGLGSYIVNTTGCVDCHTYPSYLKNGDPFLGLPEMINFQQYMTGGRMFGPAITAPNLTPDSTGNPAGMTLQQFITTLRTGHSPNDPEGKILQVMPWPVIGKKTDLDIAAMYEYLKAIPSLPDNPAPGP